MAEDHTALFMDWELEGSMSSELKREKQLSAPQRRHYNLCRRKVRDNKLWLVFNVSEVQFQKYNNIRQPSKGECIEQYPFKRSVISGIQTQQICFISQSFAAFVASKLDSSHKKGTCWCCCSKIFTSHSAIHKHVARTHHSEIQQLTKAAYQRLVERLEEDFEVQQPMELKVQSVDISAWIPDTVHVSEQQLLQ